MNISKNVFVKRAYIRLRLLPLLLLTVLSGVMAEELAELVDALVEEYQATLEDDSAW